MYKSIWTDKLFDGILWGILLSYGVHEINIFKIEIWGGEVGQGHLEKKSNFLNVDNSEWPLKVKVKN